MTYLTTVLSDQKTNISFLKTTVTAHQNVTTSWVLVEGGQITYTPSSASADIIFEFTTAFGRKDPDNSIMFQLQIGSDASSLGDIVTNNVDYINEFGTTTTAHNTSASDLITLRYKLSGWSGAKVLQVQCKTYDSSSNLESIVNANRKTSTSDINLFNPFIIIYEV